MIQKLYATLFLSLSILLSHANAREWTDIQGRRMQADFVRTESYAKGTDVVFKMSNGMHSRVPLSILSEADQNYIRSLKSSSAQSTQTSRSPDSGNYVDVFIATGQSNAAYPLFHGEENKFGFGRGVRKALVSSGLFSKPVVVMDGSPGHAIGSWWAHYKSGPTKNYDTQFFDTDNNGTGKL